MWRLSICRLRVGNATFVTSIAQAKMPIMYIFIETIKDNKYLKTIKCLGQVAKMGISYA